MSKIYSPRIVQDSLVMCLDASNNKSYPTDLPVKNGLVMWMDAADDTTFSYSSGTTVSQWRDKSGFNYHMTPAAPLSTGPSRNTSLNSRKTLTFTTTQSIGSLSFTVETSANTVFVVSRLTGTTNSRVLTAYYNNWLLGHWGGQFNQYYAEGWIAYGGYAADTTWRMYMGDWGGSSNDVANAYSNGTLITNQTTSQASAGPKGLGINYQSGEPSACEAAEIIVFNRVLSTAERRLVHTYLGQKWGISNTDRSIIDLSGFNDNGLLGNGTTANMPVYDYYNKGSLSFDGSNDYITIPSSASIKNTSSLTLEAWIYISNSMNYYGGIFGKGTTDTDEEYCLVVHSVNSKVYMDVGSSGGPYTDATFSFSLNTWYHIIGTHERAAGSSAIKIYVNGSLLSSSTVNPTNAVNDNSTAVTIGSRFSTGGSPWNGKIANAKIYTRTLSAAEALQNYEAQKSKFADTIVQQGLILNLDAGNPYSYGGAGTTVYDVSNTALSWTTNNTTYNSDPIKYFSYNGSSSWLQSSTSAAYDSQTITMECWFYPTTLTQDGFLFEKGQVNTQYSMFLAFGNTFYFRTIGGTINNQDLTFTTSTYIAANIWNHVVCTYNGSTKIVYVNGIQAASVAASGTLQTGQTNQYIGKYGAAGNNFPFNGRIAESRVYNIALSAAQVLQNYNATKGRFGL